MYIILISPCSSAIRHAAPAGVEAVVYALAHQFVEMGARVDVVGVAESQLPPGVTLRQSTHESLSERLSQLVAEEPHALFCDHSGIAFQEPPGVSFFRLFHVAPEYVFVPEDMSRCGFVSAFLRDAFANDAAAAAGCPILYNGLSLPDDWAATQWRSDAAEARFLYIGRMNRLKGIDLAVAACQRRGVVLDVYGGFGRDRPSDVVFNDLGFLTELESMYGDAIRYHGPVLTQAEKRAALLATGALIIPSREPESCSLVALEAASLGTPIIAIEHGGITEYVPECIEFVPPADDESMIVALADSMGAIGTRASNSLPARFGAREMALRYLRWWRTQNAEV